MRWALLGLLLLTGHIIFFTWHTDRAAQSFNRSTVPPDTITGVPEVVLDPTPFAAAAVDIAPVLLAQGRTGSWPGWRVSLIPSGCDRGCWRASGATWACWDR